MKEKDVSLSLCDHSRCSYCGKECVSRSLFQRMQSELSNTLSAKDERITELERALDELRREKKDIEETQALLPAIRSLCREATSHAVSPLFLACREGNLRLVRAFLTWDCKKIPHEAWEVKQFFTDTLQERVNRTVKWGECTYSPLHISVRKGHEAVAAFLISQKANVNEKDKFDKPLLYIANKYKHGNIVRLLLSEGADIDTTNWNKETMLPFACVSGYCEFASLLIDFKANIEAKDTLDGYTPLHYAASKGNMRTVSLLIARRANLETRNHGGHCTPLHTAAKGNNKDMAVLLLASKADIDSVTEYKWTPLHYAVVDGHESMVTLLVAHRADLEATTKNQYTPLHCAACNGRTTIASFLVKEKANLEAKEKDGMSPLGIAIGRGYEELVALFSEHTMAEE